MDKLDTAKMLIENCLGASLREITRDSLKLAIRQIEEYQLSVKYLDLANVSKCESIEREHSCKHSDWVDLYYSSGDIYGRYCNDCGEFFE